MDFAVQMPMVTSSRIVIVAETIEPVRERRQDQALEHEMGCLNLKMDHEDRDEGRPRPQVWVSSLSYHTVVIIFGFFPRKMCLSC